MQALILVGGLGKRMRPLTDKVPKVLLPVAEKPSLLYLINSLKDQVDEFILATGYKGKMIEDYFGDGSKFGTKIIYSKEESPLDTGGAVKLAEDLIEGNEILVLNGDIFIDIDVKKMLRVHHKMKTPITLAVTKVKDSGRFGQVTIEDDIITEFKEKGESEEGFINAGVYVFKKEILESFPKDKSISLERDIFPKFVSDMATFETKGYFIDIGVKEDYDKICQKIKAEKLFF